jgi:hypothetical protein
VVDQEVLGLDAGDEAGRAPLNAPLLQGEQRGLQQEVLVGRRERGPAGVTGHGSPHAGADDGGTFTTRGAPAVSLEWERLAAFGSLEPAGIAGKGALRGYRGRTIARKRDLILKERLVIEWLGSSQLKRLTPRSRRDYWRTRLASGVM